MDTDTSVECRWYAVAEVLDPKAEHGLGTSAVISAVRLPAVAPAQRFWSGKVLLPLLAACAYLLLPVWHAPVRRCSTARALGIPDPRAPGL